MDTDILSSHHPAAGQLRGLESSSRNDCSRPLERLAAKDVKERKLGTQFQSLGERPLRIESNRRRRGRRKLIVRYPEDIKAGEHEIDQMKLTKKKLSHPWEAIYLLLLLVLAFGPLLLIRAQSQTITTTQGYSRQQGGQQLPDLVSATSDEPIVAIVGQDAFISCVAKNLQNYTIIWRYTNDASAPGLQADSKPPGEQTTTNEAANSEMGAILTAGRQRVTVDERFSVIQSHDTWLLKISNVRLADTGTYICHTNSEPRVRVLRILSVIRSTTSTSTGTAAATGIPSRGQVDVDTFDLTAQRFEEINYNFTDCCRDEYVVPRCQRLCDFQQLASRYQSINIVHECYSALPSISRCMVAGRNVTDCCQKRHIPGRCNPMCGHLGDTSAMSVQDQSYCADYSASIMSCVAEGISTLPGQPELVIVEAVSSSTLKVSWQKVTDENELRKLDGWIINLTKLSSFEDTISDGGQTTSPSASSSETTRLSSSSSDGALTSQPRVTSSFSSSSSQQQPAGSQQQPLANLTIVDVMNNSSLAAMTKLLAASSGTISLKLDKRNNEFSIENLKPYTVYQIQMFAYNSRGRSQLTDPIRALTLAPESDTSSANSDAYVEPSLPDTRKCCIDRGVTLSRCLNTLCDPVEADRATIADLMICAPWSNVTFSCLSSRVNHTECCKARGVSPFCQSMCAGDVKRVDYRHFRCLTHMSTYTNCILESHNVLPSQPQNFTVGPITHTWAVLNWRAPRKHARSLQGYRIFWRRVGTKGNTTNSLDLRRRLGDSELDDFYYSSAEAATNPYLLDGLQPETVYEAFVVAVNRFGQSESSVRFVFQTLSDPEKVRAKQEATPGDGGDTGARLPLHGGSEGKRVSYYNETTCCANSGLHSGCLQLCDYDLRVTDVGSLITSCNLQMPVILRCMAGSRNSVPCCRNHGVADHCLNACAGLTEHSPLVLATRCASDFGKIIRCMDEGSKQIPSAPIDLHTSDIKPSQVSIKWAPAKEDVLRSDVEYHVRYQQLQQAPTDSSSSPSDLSSLIAVVPLHPLEHNLILTTNRTEATIDKLRPGARYSVYVTAENPYGISLPSLVLVLQTPTEAEMGPTSGAGGVEDTSAQEAFKRRATLGAPHSLEVLRSDTESIVLKWLPPLFISNEAQIRYRVFYKLLAGQTNETEATSGGGSASNGVIQQVASNWSILETADTTSLLRNLRYSSQYVITVQAFSKQLLGHMSEILLVSTAKPVPPTLNQPLVINPPIEGNNITIMCVALGQPTPQISMFINGLLVQKRTQPYVIYHLVNLVRGQLTITCFASNGHGKDYASVQSRTEVSVKFGSKAVAKTREVRSSLQSLGRLTCDVSGNPQPSVVWTFVGSENATAPSSGAPPFTVITPNERITTLLVSQFDNPFTWSHTLTIRNLSQADLGTYQCRAHNPLADSSDSIQLSGYSGSLVPSPSSAAASNTSGATNQDQLSYLKQVEQNSDLMQCCKGQNVSLACLPVCSPDGLDVEAAFKTAECQADLNKLMYCAADGSDHRNCCRTRQVPSTCLRWCSGSKLSMPAFCFLASAIDINQCFQEGRTLLPGPPRNVRALLASQSEHGSGQETRDNAASPGATPEVATTTMNSNLFPIDKLGQAATATTTAAAEGAVAATGPSGTNPSVISSMVMMMGDQAQPTPAEPTSGSAPESPGSTTAEGQAQQPMTEPLIIEWDPPTKNPSLVQYYRIFWRPFGSRELSRTVTNLTWIRLNDLNMNKIYEFVVKAANPHGSSVYSDPLTVRPAEIMAQSNSLGAAGLIWFMPSSGSSSLLGRIMMAICFATLFMFSSLALVMFLERHGYLKRFASSKSNSSRISFANPAYLKDGPADGAVDGDNITWDAGHSLDILAPPPAENSATTQQQAPSAVVH